MTDADERADAALDRRKFLTAAVASTALAAPVAAVAQEAAPKQSTQSNAAGRREQAMSTGGLSSARLRRMHDVMAGHVARGGLAGPRYGTSAYMDRKEDMVAILMTQRLWDSPRAPDVQVDFWTQAYQAIDD